jgi:peptidoglycan/xylan/chitin deacetylase (PgdA/CDA1 family)
MRWLSRHARLLSVDDLVTLLQDGDPLPRRAVVVTLDDGFRNNYLEALPVLRRYRVPAAVYVITGFVEGQPQWIDRLDTALESIQRPEIRADLPDREREFPYRGTGERQRTAHHLRQLGKRLAGEDRERLVRSLSAQAGVDLGELAEEVRPADTRALTPGMVREMSQEGITIGSHTVNHEILTRCSRELLKHEVRFSREKLEKWCGRKVTHFAYPNGGPEDFNETTEEALREAGYGSALLTIPGTTRPGVSAMQIPRVHVSGDEGRAEFLADLSGIRPTLLALRRILRFRMGTRSGD